MWDAWTKKLSGKDMVPARDPSKGKLKVLCDAPGEYVAAKA